LCTVLGKSWNLKVFFQIPAISKCSCKFLEFQSVLGKSRKLKVFLESPGKMQFTPGKTWKNIVDSKFTNVK